MPESKLSPEVQAVLKDVQAGKFASISEAIAAVQKAGGEISQSSSNREVIAAMKKAKEKETIVSVERQAAPFSLKETRDGKLSVVNRWFCSATIKGESFAVIINFGQNEPEESANAHLKIESFEGVDSDNKPTTVEFLKFIKFV